MLHAIHCRLHRIIEKRFRNFNIRYCFAGKKDKLVEFCDDVVLIDFEKTTCRKATFDVIFQRHQAREFIRAHDIIIPKIRGVQAAKNSVESKLIANVLARCVS